MDFNSENADNEKTKKIMKKENTEWLNPMVYQETQKDSFPYIVIN